MNTKSFMKKHSSTILTFVGTAGVIFTAVSAVKATPKALKLIEDRKEELNVEELPKIEVAKATWECYIPATVIGMSTIACIMGANILNKKNQAAIISAYSLLDNAFKEYKEHANKVYGEDADKEIRRSIVQDHCSDTSVKPEGDKHLFFDMNSNRYFESTLMEVYRAEYELNRGYSKFGYCCLNDFYDLIGIDKIEGGYEIGWSMDASNMFYNYDCIDFEHELVFVDDDLPCYVIVTPYPPTADYLC